MKIIFLSNLSIYIIINITLNLDIFAMKDVITKSIKLQM